MNGFDSTRVSPGILLCGVQVVAEPRVSGTLRSLSSQGLPPRGPALRRNAIGDEQSRKCFRGEWVGDDVYKIWSTETQSPRSGRLCDEYSENIVGYRSGYCGR